MNAVLGRLMTTTADLIAALRADSPDVVKAREADRRALEEQLSRAAKDYGFTVCGT